MDKGDFTNKQNKHVTKPGAGKFDLDTGLSLKTKHRVRSSKESSNKHKAGGKNFYEKELRELKDQIDFHNMQQR